MQDQSAPLPPDTFLRPRDVAARTGFAVATLAAMRCRGEGPPYHKVTARTVVYRWGEVIAWLGTSRRSTSDLQPPARVA
jgi:predicted DNA-binding transcriptional regulator AlpA